MRSRTAETIQTEGVPRSVGRVLDLLEIVLAEESCTLTHAAATSGLTPTTALRHLRALEARGYLDRDANGVFSAGPTLARIAGSLRDDGPLERLVTAAQPHLDALAAGTGESAYLAMSDRKVATYIATAESNRAIRHVGWVGQNVTLEGTAVGQALAAPGVVVTRTGAVEPDITALSLALRDRGKLGFAISIIGPQHRLDAKAAKQAEAMLLRSVSGLSRDLGIDNNTPMPQAGAS
ncbi:MAG: helix-turn-helix domain-containing protein [Actinomycetia bacterium]|nr:helix-turn-helix domain-containing protein [Actinomycetes bacterium]